MPDGDASGEFLLELYVSGADPGAVAAATGEAERAAAELAGEGRPLRFVRSIFVPDDETCFLLYEAARVEDVEEAARRASLPFARISRAAARPKGEAR